MIQVPLTVVILTHNEADTIRRAVGSVQWANEIILIDNSSDDTVELAKRAYKTIRVLHDTSQVTDFGRLRNIALTHATNDWVLFLDADEEVSPALRDEIELVVRENREKGFYVPRRDFFLGQWLRYGETGNIKLLKLGRRDGGKWRRRVHEVWDIKDSIGQLSNHLNHYPHPTIAEFVSRINRWTTLDAEEFFETGKRSSFIKIIVYPVAKFVRNYMYKQGFRDGMAGMIMAMLMSFHSFLTRAKLYLLQTGRS